MRLFSRKGFTLIELIIAIAILGIMAAIATPSYQTFMAQRRLNGAARQVMSDLMAARMKAVSLNQKVKVSFLSNHTYGIWNDANNDLTVDNNEGDNISKDIYFNYNDVILSNYTDPTFQPRGTSSAAAVTLNNSSGSKEITVAITGRVKIN